MKLYSITVSQAEVYWYLSDNGAATAQQIAWGIDLAKGTVSSNALVLEKAGVLKSWQLKTQGKPKLYSLSESPPSKYIVYIKEFESLARSAWRLRGIEPAILSYR